MSSTKLTPKFDSSTKGVPFRRPNISNDFSNWNKLLNNVNVVVKNTKKISEKVKVKEKIIDKISLVDIKLNKINSNIRRKISEEGKNYSKTLNNLLAATPDGKDKDDDKARHNLILENIEKNDIEKSLDYLRKRYRYYRYLQHQEIVYIERMRQQKIEEEKSLSGYLRTIGPPLIITVGLTSVVIGINLLFITNIAGMPFWVTLCDKMVNSKLNKFIFEATINIMSSFGLFTSSEIASLRTLYSAMLLEISSLEFKNSATNISEFATKIFSSTDFQAKDGNKKTFAFFNQIKNILESRNPFSDKSKKTLSEMNKAKDMAINYIFGKSITDETITGKNISKLLPTSTALKFVMFVVDNYNSPIFKWSFSLLGTSFQLFKFVNVSIDKVMSHPNSSDIIIFRELTTSILNSYTSNQLITFISSTVSDIPYFISEKITTSNIEYFLSPAKTVIDKISPIASSSKKYISPVIDYISPVADYITESIGEIKSYVESYLKSYIAFTPQEISTQIVELETEKTKIINEIDDDKKTKTIFGPKISDILQNYDNISLCLQNSKTFENIKKCYTDFIVYLINLYPKDQEKTFAPKILEDTLKTINEKTDVESIKKEMEKIFNYYSGVFLSTNTDKLSGINNRFTKNQEKLKHIQKEINDLNRKKIEGEIDEIIKQSELLKKIPEKDRNNQESSKKIKEKFKANFDFKELQKLIINFLFNMKTQNQKLKSYLGIIKKIEKVRAKNNKN